MERNHRTLEWSRRRTQTLLRLFKTQAPPDFRAQVLRRARERQHTVLSQPDQERAWQEFWQWSRPWLIATWHTAPRLLGTVRGLGGACALIVGVSLTGWLLLTRAPLPTPEKLSLGAAQQDGQTTPTQVDGAPLESNREVLPGAVPTAHMASVDPQSPPSRAEAPNSRPAPPAHIGRPPVVPPVPWTAIEMVPPKLTPPPRLSHKRPGPVKGKRAKKTFGTGKQVPT